MLDPRGQLLRAAVGFAGCSMPSYDRALWALRTWLDSWTGIGHVAVGMHRQGYDLQLTQYDERGWSSWAAMPARLLGQSRRQSPKMNSSGVGSLSGGYRPAVQICRGPQ